MARRSRRSLAALSSLDAPWWFWIAAAAASYVLIAKLVPAVLPPGIAAGGLTVLLSGAGAATGVAGLLAAMIAALRQSGRDRLLEAQLTIQDIRGLSWNTFEELMAEYYRRKGYSVELTGGGGADGGVDLVVRRSGECVLVQCKAWRNTTVGVRVARELLGIVAARRATAGVVVISGSFTKDTVAFATGQPIDLVDGLQLAAMIRQVNGGEALAAKSGCPECGGAMSIRRNRKDHSEFLGCTRYPECKGTKALRR